MHLSSRRGGVRIPTAFGCLTNLLWGWLSTNTTTQWYSRKPRCDFRAGNQSGSYMQALIRQILATVQLVPAVNREVDNSMRRPGYSGPLPMLDTEGPCNSDINATCDGSPIPKKRPRMSFNTLVNSTLPPSITFVQQCNGHSPSTSSMSSPPSYCLHRRCDLARVRAQPCRKIKKPA